ncbi:MAG: hypothetical protein EHM88_10605, partial [Candidatus Rokuibacteriota bacterium]
LNMPFEGTVDIAIYLTIRSILLDSDRHGNVPANSGLFRPITITAPEGCLANPRFPAPTIARRAEAARSTATPWRRSGMPGCSLRCSSAAGPFTRRRCSTCS